jgi:hypothetical protein
MRREDAVYRRIVEALRIEEARPRPKRTPAELRRDLRKGLRRVPPCRSCPRPATGDGLCSTNPRDGGPCPPLCAETTQFGRSCRGVPDDGDDLCLNHRKHRTAAMVATDLEALVRRVFALERAAKRRGWAELPSVPDPYLDPRHSPPSADEWRKGKKKAAQARSVTVRVRAAIRRGRR